MVITADAKSAKNCVLFNILNFSIYGFRVKHGMTSFVFIVFHTQLFSVDAACLAKVLTKAGAPSKSSGNNSVLHSALCSMLVSKHPFFVNKNFLSAG